jgi:MFS family permease
VLFLGRVLGGISTTLMYSVFESWMVTEYYVQNLDKSTLSLSSMFGLMTTLNSGTAILSGVIGESIVSYTETKTSPFMASIVCLALAAWAMQTYWVCLDWTPFKLSPTLLMDLQSENHGDSASQSSTTEKSGFAIILADRRILVLGLISTAFEGTMYLFVFFWSAAMKSVHARALIAASDFVTSASILPFGLIFATFMASMMLGSLGFSAASSYASKSTVQFVSGVKSIFSSASMLVFAIGTASSALLLTVLIKDEKITFWLFCLFEACIGIYFPSMAYQKGRIVDDGVRAKVYGILRIPLNCFVVAALSLTKEGEFSSC